MGNMSIIVGLTAVSIIVAYIMFKINQNSSSEDGQLKDNHGLLQVFMFFFIIFNVFLIGKVTLDDKDYCAWNTVNSTTIGSTTTYGYEYQCQTNTHNTALIFYRTITGLVAFIGVYILVFYSYKILLWFKEIVGMK